MKMLFENTGCQSSTRSTQWGEMNGDNEGHTGTHKHKCILCFSVNEQQPVQRNTKQTAGFQLLDTICAITENLNGPPSLKFSVLSINLPHFSEHGTE